MTEELVCKVGTEADQLRMSVCPTEKRIPLPAMRNPGGCAAIKNSIVRGWITFDANLGLSVRTVKRSLNSSLSKLTFFYLSRRPLRASGHEKGIMIAVTTSRSDSRSPCASWVRPFESV